MKATSSQRKIDLMLRRSLLLVLGLLVAVLYAPEKNVLTTGLVVAPACVAKGGAAERLQVVAHRVRAGVNSITIQTKAVTDLSNFNVRLTDSSNSWEAGLAALKSGDKYDYDKIVNYLIGQVMKGITGISWSEYVTLKLSPPLALQPKVALTAKQLASKLPQQQNPVCYPATAEQGRLAFLQRTAMAITSCCKEQETEAANS